MARLDFEYVFFDCIVERYLSQDNMQVLGVLKPLLSASYQDAVSLYFRAFHSARQCVVFDVPWYYRLYSPFDQGQWQTLSFNLMSKGEWYQDGAANIWSPCTPRKLYETEFGYANLKVAYVQQTSILVETAFGILPMPQQASPKIYPNLSQYGRSKHRVASPTASRENGSSDGKLRTRLMTRSSYIYCEPLSTNNCSRQNTTNEDLYASLSGRSRHTQ
jgi:hypothetical protein